jgi:hypothetical protein
MDGYFTNCLSRGINLEGKSNNGRSPRVHKASAMLWRKGHNPSFVCQNNKVWVPVNVHPCISGSLPPPILPIFEENGSSSNDVQPNSTCNPQLCHHRIFCYREYKIKLVFFLLLCFKVSALLLFYQFGSYAYVAV